jgi:hypothetical protein
MSEGALLGWVFILLHCLAELGANKKALREGWWSGEIRRLKRHKIEHSMVGR